MDKNQTGRKVLFIAAGIYTVILLCLMLVRITDKQCETDTYIQALRKRFNFMPFRSITEFIAVLLTESTPYAKWHSIKNLAGNVILFIPYGFLLPYMFRKCRKYYLTLLWTASIIVIIEILQLFTLRGSFDVDDVILNSTGVSIGYSIYRCYCKRMLHKQKMYSNKISEDCR